MMPNSRFFSNAVRKLLLLASFSFLLVACVSLDPKHITDTDFEVANKHPVCVTLAIEPLAEIATGGGWVGDQKPPVEEYEQALRIAIDRSQIFSGVCAKGQAGLELNVQISHRVYKPDECWGVLAMIPARWRLIDPVSKHVLYEDKPINTGIKDRGFSGPKMIAAAFDMAARSSIVDGLQKISRLDLLETQVFSAARAGDMEQVRALVKRAQDNKDVRNSALLGAVTGGQVDVARKLVVEHKVQDDIRDKSGNTLLMLAAAENKMASVRYLVEERGAKPNVVSTNGDSALSLAVGAGHLDVARYLLSQGATDGASKPSALSVALRTKNTAAINLLMESGADLGPGSSKAPGVLYWAAINNNYSLVNKLIGLGAAFPALPEIPGGEKGEGDAKVDRSDRLERAYVSRSYARGLLWNNRLAESIPYLKEAMTIYKQAEADLGQIRITFGYSTVSAERLSKHTMAMVFTKAAGSEIPGEIKTEYEKPGVLRHNSKITRGDRAYYFRAAAGLGCEQARGNLGASINNGVASIKKYSKEVAATYECVKTATQPGAAAPVSRCL